MRRTERTSCPRTFRIISETIFFLTNRIPLSDVKKSLRSHVNKIKMADNEEAPLKQKLSDDEKSRLISFYKDNKELWSSSVSYRREKIIESRRSSSKARNPRKKGNSLTKCLF